jgi:light-regulated signal transduction histidine kinase (bacteriophytochrome)
MQEIDPITADVIHSAIHGLKGPANRLRLLSQLLARGGETSGEEARTLLGYIQTSAAEVGSAAEGLRRYVEICGRPMRREALDLNQTLESAISGVQGEIEKTGAQITRSALPSVHADAFLMTWLFQELFTNSNRCRSAGAPRMHVSSGAGGPAGWFVSVSDNGRGLESGMEEQVFRPFKKLSGEGAGLGLTICRHIVERHEGRIWVEPREEGVEVRFFVGGT